MILDVYKRQEELTPYLTDEKVDAAGLNESEKKLRFAVHSSIKKVTEDCDRFSFNTAISSIMEMVNALYAYKENTDSGDYNNAVITEAIENLIILMSPFVPHIAFEMWENIGKTEDLSYCEWPKYDAEALKVSSVEAVSYTHLDVYNRQQLVFYNKLCYNIQKYMYYQMPVNVR